MRQEKREELLQASSAVYSGTGIFHFKTRRANKGLRGFEARARIGLESVNRFFY